MTPEQTREIAHAVLAQIERIVVGKTDTLRLVMLGLMAGGHILIEDMPGLGKTLIAKCFAGALGLSFTRVQFTPDLLPSDLTGIPVYDEHTRQVTFHPGPVFTNLLLADEINRTPPKTQAALLEAMGEHQVSIEGETRPLPAPFVVLATDNPIEYEGTFPLPEAQLDRFTLRVSIGYLRRADEAAMIRDRLYSHPKPEELPSLVGPSDVVEMIASVDQIEVHDDVIDYIVELVNATREHPKTQVGASPRGALALTQLARAHALLAGRSFVTPGDVKTVASPALAHRIMVKPELWARGLDGTNIVADVLGDVPTPATQHSQAAS